eukprot:gene4830-5295_t
MTSERVLVPEYLLSAAADYREGKELYLKSDYDLSVVKFHQSINKLAENDTDYMQQEQSCCYGSLERVASFVNLQITKSMHGRQCLSELYNNITETKAKNPKEKWPTFLFLMALQKECKLGHLRRSQRQLFLSQNVLGMHHGLLADTLAALANCCQCQGLVGETKQYLRCALRLYLVLFGECSFKYAITLSRIESLPKEVNSPNEVQSIRSQLSKLWPEVFGKHLTLVTIQKYIEKYT